MKPKNLTPRHLIESLKLTYDMSYGNEMAGKMVAAAYPQATEDDRVALMVMALHGFVLGNRPYSIKDWNLCDVEEFIDLYQREFQMKNNEIIGYHMVNDLFVQIAEQTARLVPAIPEGLPFWFKNAYLNKAFERTTHVNEGGSEVLSTAARNFHQRLFNIPCPNPQEVDIDVSIRTDDVKLAYRIGHRDARQAAAEIGLEADKVLNRLQSFEIAAQWFIDNQDSPKSAIDHFRELLSTSDL